MKKIVNGELIDMTPAEIAELEELRNRVDPAPVPEEISDRQFFHALAILKMITEDEALVAVKTGDPPAAMSSFISALPYEQRFGARMLLEGATTFRRSHPLTAAFGDGMNLNSGQVDALWRIAASL